MAHEQPGVAVEGDSKGAERHEKGAAAFMGTYETALAFRDFAYGKEAYDSKLEPIKSFIGYITDRARNLAVKAIKENDIDPDFQETKLTEDIGKAQERIIRFEEGGETFKLFHTVHGYLQVLKEAIVSGDPIKILEAAVGLDKYFTGLLYANEILLTKADEASGHHNSLVRR
jgi:hypothetical protein